MIPDWKLPPGVDRGLWDYVTCEPLARRYDESLEGSPLLQLDLQFADEYLPNPCRVVDLGCGTGRACLHFAHRGFECVGVDLSEAMLAVLQEKAPQIPVIRANLVELDGIALESFDAALCLFSTLGMIRGRDNRLKFLKHVRRIVKPGGMFIVHAHHRGYRWGRASGRRGAEAGDRAMPQTLLAAPVTLHHFTRRELLRDLRDAGFAIRECRPITTTGRLTRGWFFGGYRTYGFMVAAVAEG